MAASSTSASISGRTDLDCMPIDVPSRPSSHASSKLLPEIRHDPILPVATAAAYERLRNFGVSRDGGKQSIRERSRRTFGVGARSRNFPCLIELRSI